MKVVSDVLHLSYLDKFGLRVTVKAGKALAVLYSEARLYKSFSVDCYTFYSTGIISVWVQKVGHSNTRGIVSSLFFSRSEITAALSLHLYED